MKGLFIAIVSAVGALVAASASTGCLYIFVDEPQMPKTMIEK